MTSPNTLVMSWKGKTSLIVCSDGFVSISDFSYFTVWFRLRTDFGFDCISSWPLLICYFINVKKCNNPAFLSFH